MPKNFWAWGLFFKSPETFRAHLRSYNYLFICTTTSRGTKLCRFFFFFSFLFPLQHTKRAALKNKRDRVLGMAFRPQKHFGFYKHRILKVGHWPTLPRSRLIPVFFGKISICLYEKAGWKLRPGSRQAVLKMFHINSPARFAGLKEVRTRIQIPLTRRNVAYEYNGKWNKIVTSS